MDPFPPPPPAGRAAAPNPLVINTPETLVPTRNGVRELIGATIGGRYQIRGVLGEGGMGTVYDAEHLGLGRFVAIKVLNPSQAKKRVAVKRFQQEARAAGAIGHPNICEVYDMGLLDDGSPYLVMEKLVGRTLADRIAKHGGLPFDEIVEMMVQVLSGLIAAHDKGIVHRDIKPENIFLAKRLGPPIAKILDFGVSKMMPQFANNEEQLDLTRTGMVMGTPYYMSPEQARGERNLDGRVDVYATGVMLYETIAGKRPFLAPNYNALLLAIINTQPRALRDVRPDTPPALEAIVARAMAKNRGERYPSAAHFLRDVQALALPKSLARPPAVPPPPTPEERARAPILGGNEPPRSHRSVSRSAAREPASRADGPGAMLQRRMADGAGQFEQSTRLDIKIRGAEPPAPSDSVEVITDMLGSETPALPVRHEGPPPVQVLPSALLEDSDSSTTEYVDEAPTEVFRPGKHPSPKKAPAAAGSDDDWEGETVVRSANAPLPMPRRRDRLQPINPDETVKLEPRKGESLPLEGDFIDETRVAPPRRPR